MRCATELPAACGAGAAAGDAHASSIDRRSLSIATAHKDSSGANTATGSKPRVSTTPAALAAVKDNVRT